MPRWAGYRNTLGVAQYRKGDYTAAIESLGRSRALDDTSSSSTPAIDSYFLAMAHAKLGQADLAEKWFRAAELWMAMFAATNEELKRFRQEAIDVVGVEIEPIVSRPVTPKTEEELFELCSAADPQAGWIRLWMGNRLAERGAWSEADEQLAQAAASLPENSKALSWHALMRLKLGDQEGYRQACARMCERFGKTAGSPDSHQLAWICGLVSDALQDMSVPLAQSEKCACWNGLLLFRCGRYEDAITQLKKRITASEAPGTLAVYGIYPHIVLAMIHWQLGHQAEARKSLSVARAVCKQESLAKMTWRDRTTLELLLAEADQMIPSGD
jgi:tetratricopeptide (TPR) repeat protein